MSPHHGRSPAGVNGLPRRSSWQLRTMDVDASCFQTGRGRAGRALPSLPSFPSFTGQGNKADGGWILAQRPQQSRPGHGFDSGDAGGQQDQLRGGQLGQRRHGRTGRALLERGSVVEHVGLTLQRWRRKLRSVRFPGLGLDLEWSFSRSVLRASGWRPVALDSASPQSPTTTPQGMASTS